MALFENAMLQFSYNNPVLCNMANNCGTFKQKCKQNPTKQNKQTKWYPPKPLDNGPVSVSGWALEMDRWRWLFDSKWPANSCRELDIQLITDDFFVIQAEVHCSHEINSVSPFILLIIKNQLLNCYYETCHQ